MESVPGGRSPGILAAMSDEQRPTPEESAEEILRPCDYCGHPVALASVDERDCPVCGEPDGANE